jgi:hypothetical protein
MNNGLQSDAELEATFANHPESLIFTLTWNKFTAPRHAGTCNIKLCMYSTEQTHEYTSYQQALTPSHQIPP